MREEGLVQKTNRPKENLLGLRASVDQAHLKTDSRGKIKERVPWSSRSCGGTLGSYGGKP